MRFSEQTRSLRSKTNELETNLERVQDLERENAMMHKRLMSMSSNLDLTKNQLTSMQWKGEWKYLRGERGGWA